MKRLLTAIFTLALIGFIFSSCKKDETTPLSNSVTIQGEFTIGDKTFTNPTFDLGEPQKFVGYFRNFIKSKEFNGFNFFPTDNIDLGNNVSLSFDNEIYSVVVGPATMFIELHFYFNGNSSFSLYSETATATVTKGTFKVLTQQKLKIRF